LECTVTILRHEGMPQFLQGFRRRHALLAGAALCTMALFFGSFFIWDFAVEGNETVSREEILRSLQKNGVTMGTFGFSLDAEDLRNHVLLEIPELSWITVNVSGCRAYVQVRERVPAPEIVDERSPANIVARRAGLVRRVEALNGVTCVLPGTAVTEGQLLISGMEDTGTFGARLLPGMGRVTARTWHTYRTVVPLETTVKHDTGEERTVYSLVLGTHRLKFYRNSSIEDREYDKITKRMPLRILGISLPAVWVQETYRFYEPVSRKQSVREAETQAKAWLTEYLHTQVDPYGTVSSALCTADPEGECLSVTLTAECVEQIGTQVPIYTEETGE